MIKNGMVTRTIEGFIRKLKEDGHEKYASELRVIMAMSRARRGALLALSGITVTLLTHLVKYLALPQSTDRGKWIGEIKSYLSTFSVDNRNYRGRPWLSIEYIQNDLNDTLRGPAFKGHMKRELSTYPKVDQNNVLSIVETHKSLKSMGVRLFFDSDNDVGITINDRVL
jgi:hypothetical protein